MRRSLAARLLAAFLVAVPVLLGAPAEPSKDPIWSALVPRAAGAGEHFAGPEGKPGNPGTREAPWDLASALSGERKIEPGEVLWVLGGTYRGKLEVKVSGTEAAPVFVRASPGERATILDGGLSVVEPASHIWIWDLEIAGSAPVSRRESKQGGSSPTDLPPLGGLNVLAGKGCKFIDLWIHDNVGGGVGWWVGSTDGEFHGCVIHDNGWRGPDRGHGHSIYTQNKDGTKTISSCILSVPHEGSYTMHAYGSSRAYVDNYVLEENIAWEKGPFLVGGGRPSRNIKVLRNYLYKVDMRLGYGAQNEDCEIRDNVIAHGGLVIEKFRKVAKEGNVTDMPAKKAVLVPNKYDPRRANLVIYNGARAPEVSVDAGPFLGPGEPFRLMDPKDLHGKPAFQGASAGTEIRVPVKGEFAVYVVLKGQ